MSNTGVQSRSTIAAQTAYALFNWRSISEERSGGKTIKDYAEASGLPFIHLTDRNGKDAYLFAEKDSLQFVDLLSDVAVGVAIVGPANAAGERPVLLQPLGIFGALLGPAFNIDGGILKSWEYSAQSTAKWYKTDDGRYFVQANKSASHALH